MRFLPIVTQIFLWTAVFSADQPQRHRRLFPQRHRRLLPADDGHPGLLQHAGPRQRHRPQHPRRLGQEVSDPAGRLRRLPAGRPRRPQARLLRRGGAPFALVFFLCRSFFPPLPDATTIAAFLLSLLLWLSCSASSWRRRSGCSASGSSRSRASCSATCSCSICSRATCFRIDMLAGIPTGIPGISLADLVRWLPLPVHRLLSRRGLAGEDRQGRELVGGLLRRGRPGSW